MFGWLKSRRLKKQAEAKRMIADSRTIMDSVESPYRTARSLISEYEASVEFSPRSACKSAKKAYRSAVAESEIAQTYTHARELLDAQRALDDSKIVSLDSKYMACMAKGNYKKARKIADKLDLIASSEHDPSEIRIAIDRAGLDDGEIKIVISNRSDRSVNIDSIACSCGSKQIDVQKGMSEACRPGSQHIRTVRFEGDKAMGLTVVVTYEIDFVRRVMTRQFTLLNKV